MSADIRGQIAEEIAESLCRGIDDFCAAHPATTCDQILGATYVLGDRLWETMIKGRKMIEGEIIPREPPKLSGAR